MRHGPVTADSTSNSTRSSTSDSGTVLGFCGSWAGSIERVREEEVGSATARSSDHGDHGDERERT